MKKNHYKPIFGDQASTLFGLTPAEIKIVEASAKP